MFQKKAIFINTASQVIVRFITLAFTLISIKLLTNYLGPAGVGNYNTITTYVNFFIVLADLGLFSVAVREIAKHPDKEKKLLSNVLIIRLISALAATIIAIIIVFSTKYNQDIKLGTLFASGFIFLNLLSSVYDVVFQYRLKMQYSALSEFLSKLIALLALYLIIKNGGSFLWICLTITLSGLSIFLFKFIFSRQFVKFAPGFEKGFANWILSLAWPIGLVYIVSNLFFKLDTIILFIIKGASAVGIYSVAYKVLEVTVFIGAYFASALKPALSSYMQKDKKALAKLIEKSFLVMLLISVPITIVCLIFSREIILFLSNSDFISGYKALILLGFTMPLIYFDMLLGEIFVANDERKLLIRIAIFILLFNLLLNLIFIPKYSFMGAAFTTLLSEIVLFGINLHYTKKIVPYKIPIATVLKILVVAFITLVAGLLLRSTGFYFLLLIAAVLLTYALFINLFKIINIQNIRSLINSDE